MAGSAGDAARGAAGAATGAVSGAASSARGAVMQQMVPEVLLVAHVMPLAV